MIQLSSLASSCCACEERFSENTMLYSFAFLDSTCALLMPLNVISCICASVSSALRGRVCPMKSEGGLPRALKEYSDREEG